MVLIVGIVAIAAGIGLLRGGSLRTFPSVEVRWWWLAAAGVALQFAPVRDDAGLATLLVSIAMLVVFAVVNIRAPGFILILIGLVLNLVVISANRGMPVTEAAIVRSGQEEALESLEEGPSGKHHLADDDTVLLPLADVIAFPPPIGAAASAGDICLYLGIGWFVVLAMRPRDVPVASAALAGVG